MSTTKKQSAQDLEKAKLKLTEQKAGLETTKKDGKSWNDAKQAELDNCIAMIADIDDLIEEAKAIEAAEAAKYKPEEGTENMLHLKVVKGRRFNPMTGEEQSKAYVQTFNKGEWDNFKKFHTSIGYTILEVLHDPFGDAAQYVAKTEGSK